MKNSRISRIINIITYVVQLKDEGRWQRELHISYCSSLLSKQSCLALHRFSGLVKFKYVAHVKVEHFSGSSEPSVQSLFPSQIADFEIHLPSFRHLNWCILHAVIYLYLW